MYATAQRVYARRAELAAINSCLYLHGDEEVDWSAPNIRNIAEAQPGRPALVVDELPPGGNEVLSYLDVAAPDGTDAQTISSALEEVAGSVGGQRGTTTDFVNGVAVRFWCTHTLEPERQSEYGELRQRVAALVEKASEGPRSSRPAPAAGLVVEVQRDELGARYVLDSASAEAVRAVHHGQWRRPRIRIADDVRADFEALHGSLFAHLPLLLTGLTEAQLGQFGVVRFVDRATRQVIGTWPEEDAAHEGA